MDLAAAILDRAAAEAVKVSLDGDRVKIIGRPSASLLAEVREHKAAILERLQRREGTRPGLPPAPRPEYAGLSWSELVERLRQETAARPADAVDVDGLRGHTGARRAVNPSTSSPSTADEKPPADPGPWPTAEAAVRLDGAPSPEEARDIAEANVGETREPPRDPPEEEPDAAALLAEARAAGAEIWAAGGELRVRMPAGAFDLYDRLQRVKADVFAELAREARDWRTLPPVERAR